MNSDELLENPVLTPSGDELGKISDILIDRNTGKINSFSVEPESGGKPAYLPSESISFKDGSFVVKEKAEMVETPGEGDLALGTSLLKTEVFAKPAWRIGVLADFGVDPDEWRLAELTVDVYPEYVITTGAHERLLPQGYPPVLQIRLPSYWATFHASEEGPKTRTHVVISIQGEDLESSVAKRLTEEWDEEARSKQATMPEESFKLRMIDAVRAAFDDAYSMS